MTDIKTHSEPWLCQCSDHIIWRKHSDYCNCTSCKNVAGAKCDRCHAVNNPLAIPCFTENNVTLCEECDELRHQQIDEDIENILRIDPDMDWKEQFR